MKLKIIGLSIIVALCSIVSLFEINAFAMDSRPKLVRKTKPANMMPYGIARFSRQGIVVIKPRSRTQIFLTSGSSSSGIYHQHPGAFAVINGAYFGRNGDGTFYPAGVWTTGEKALDPSVCQDRNLCDIYHRNTLGIGLFPLEGWFTGDYRSSGPTLLMSGVINSEILDKRSHRQRKTQRTIMIPQGPYFIVTTTGYSLPEMAEFIIKNFGKVDAINLDGGSSTSIHARNIRYNNRKLLPEFIVLQ